jgi:hypothetical protein
MRLPHVRIICNNKIALRREKRRGGLIRAVLAWFIRSDFLPNFYRFFRGGVLDVSPRLFQPSQGKIASIAVLAAQLSARSPPSKGRSV